MPPGKGTRRNNNRRVIPGITADTLLGHVAKRIYAAAVAAGLSGEKIPQLAALAPLAELGTRLEEAKQLQLMSTVKTLRMLLDLEEPGLELLLVSLACELDERVQAAALALSAGVLGAAGPRVGALISLLYPELAERPAAHASLLETAPLARYRLVRLLGPKNTPVSQCELCAEPSVLQHVVLDGAPPVPPVPAAIAGVGTVVGPADADEMDGQVPVDLGHTLDLLLAASGTVRIVSLRLQTTRIAESVARRIAAHLRRPIVVLDIRAIDKDGEEKVAVALREARLRNGLALFVNPMQMDIDEEKAGTMRRNAQQWRRMLALEKRFVLFASEPGEATDVDLLGTVGLDLTTYELPKLGILRREELFALALQRLQKDQPGGVPQIAVAKEVSSAQLATIYRVSEHEINTIIHQAAGDARLRSLVESVPPTVTMSDLNRAAREKTHRNVGKFARLVTSRYRWDDLVLPSDVKAQLADVLVSAKMRAYVHEAWGYNKKHARGLSLAVVFSGESGTGKTMSAEVIANELGVNLYQVDLSSVVSKWIGETEQHLQQIFDATEDSDCVLFFDEADALFGKRTEVNEAKDRYANIETSYLLQRIESYNGIVILSTNLRSNIDEAFLRRLQYGIRFPKPDDAAREKIWRGVFPPSAPLDGIDYGRLASQWDDLSGGQIRLIALGAAMLAAGEDRPITMHHVQRAYDNERDKMLRVVREDVILS